MRRFEYSPVSVQVSRYEHVCKMASSTNTSRASNTTPPASLIVWSTNIQELPTKCLVTIVRQLFSYGLKDVAVKNNQVTIELNYTPNTRTIIRKFGMLPIAYRRVFKSDLTKEDQATFNELTKKYKFNLSDTDAIAFGLLSPAESTTPPQMTPVKINKRPPSAIEPPALISNRKKLQKVRNIVEDVPSPSISIPEEPEKEDYDDEYDNQLFFSQKF